MINNLNEAKNRCDIHWQWDHFNLRGTPKKSCRSPFREDSHASFSVTEDGLGFHDFSTGEHGDPIRFLELVLGVPKKEACKKIIRLAGNETSTWVSKQRPPVNYKKAVTSLTAYNWPLLQKGSTEDIKRLSVLREIGKEGLQLASRLDILWFFNDQYGNRYWSVTDDGRHVRQDRRLDGKDIQLKDGNTTRSRTIGRPSWPVGLANADKPIVLLVEGSPDLLAAFHLIYSESREQDVSAVSMLGAQNSIHTSALKRFEGKRVRIFPDQDRQGLNGAAVWERQLHQAGAEVDVFDFEGYFKTDGKPVKDMNDFLCIDVDCWENDNDVRNPIPEGGSICL